MASPKGAKFVPKEKCKAIYDMRYVRVLPHEICVYYRLDRKTVSAIIRHLRNSDGHQTVKKKGR